MGNETAYGVWAVRSGASIFGYAEAWCKEGRKPLEFDTRSAAEAYAREMNGRTTANVHYYAQEKEPEPGAVRKVSLHVRSDLDACAHGEVTPGNDAAEKRNEIPGRQAMPEEKTSLMGKLKADRPEHEAGQIVHPAPGRER